jgi:hypothetical protein
MKPLSDDQERWMKFNYKYSKEVDKLKLDEAYKLIEFLVAKLTPETMPYSEFSYNMNQIRKILIRRISFYTKCNNLVRILFH